MQVRGTHAARTYGAEPDIAAWANRCALAPLTNTQSHVDGTLATAHFRTVGAFTGARLLYIIVHGASYLPHLEEILAFWQGGLSWPGAVAGSRR